MINQAGLDIIKHFEGLRLKAYKDSVGIPTIGYGHIKDVTMDTVITEHEAEQLLKNDLEVVYRAISRLIRVPLTDNQFSALCSFVFNLGGGALQRSTLRSKINRGDNPEGEWQKWCFAGGRKSKGLLKRRQAEAALYAT